MDVTPDPGPRVFLLSPANCGGVRAQMVASPAAQFDLACRLRSPGGAPLGEVFSFVSGLYFRGKLAYARRFARPPDPEDAVAAGGVLVITPNAGLRAADTPVTRESFLAFAAASIDVSNAVYRCPLEQAARSLLHTIGPDCEVVLLGSIASGKYVDVLQPIFRDRLVFPPSFVGRGDMSRGGLMLRCAAAGAELAYAPIDGAVRHGQRPPKLDAGIVLADLRPDVGAAPASLHAISARGTGRRAPGVLTLQPARGRDDRRPEVRSSRRSKKNANPSKNT